MNHRIYLDYAATTPLSRAAGEAMLPWLTDYFGNPSSVHSFGRDARKALQTARRQVAEAIGADPSEIYFTSGGAESDNWAIKGVAFARRAAGNHLITTAIEHHAVLNACKWLEKQGFEVTYLPVDPDGFVSPDQVEKAITDRTILISVMCANNEIGTIEPISEIGRVAAARHIPFHTDAVQAVGAMKLDVREMQVDMLSLSGHKLHGPKGVGALYLRTGTHIDPLIHGGGQERGLRAGTEHVAGAVGLGVAVAESCACMEETNRRVSALRDSLVEGILARIPDVRLNGPVSSRLPGNANFSFAGVEGESLLLRLDLAGIACSSGSACTSGSMDPSHVLRAIGLCEEEANGSVRMTLGRETTAEEIQEVLRILPETVDHLRALHR